MRTAKRTQMVMATLTVKEALMPKVMRMRTWMRRPRVKVKLMQIWMSTSIRVVRTGSTIAHGGNVAVTVIASTMPRRQTRTTMTMTVMARKAIKTPKMIFLQPSLRLTDAKAETEAFCPGRCWPGSAGAGVQVPRGAWWLLWVCRGPR